jgi:hypothetical protein
MPAIIRAESRRQPIANCRLPLAADDSLIARAPQGFVRRSISQITRNPPPATYKTGAKKKNRAALNQQLHTNRRHQSDFPYDFLLIERENPLPNTPEPHI